MELNIKDIIRALTETDKKILKFIENEKKYDFEISDSLNLDKVAVVNSIRRLISYNLINVDSEAKVSYTLTELGRRYLTEGLPEVFLIKILLQNNPINYNELSNLPLSKEEINAGIGILKRNSIITINNGIIKLEENADIGSISEREGALQSLSREEPIKDELINEFIKRGIVEKQEVIHQIISLNEFGKEVVNNSLFNEALIDKLTPEIIRDFKSKYYNVQFKTYDLNPNIPRSIFGKKNFVKQFINQIKSIMISMGFQEMQSNYAEASFWNFDVLMFKQDHPDRDIQDTVYLDVGQANLPNDLLSSVKKVYETGFNRDKYHFSVGFNKKFDENKSKEILMRGHTTATTFRYIYNVISKNKDKQFKFFSVSKVFRNETLDNTHLPEFYQIEGIVYGDNLKLADLMGYIKVFYYKLGFNNIRFKPTYNPYTEPSLEIQAFSNKLNRWIEVGNSGIFRPETLYSMGIDKNIIAWGFGLERILAISLGLSDIRQIYGAFSDLDLLRTTHEPINWVI